jgi:hypothetical protein
LNARILAESAQVVEHSEECVHVERLAGLVIRLISCPLILWRKDGLEEDLHQYLGEMSPSHPLCRFISRPYIGKWGGSAILTPKTWGASFVTVPVYLRKLHQGEEESHASKPPYVYSCESAAVV